MPYLPFPQNWPVFSPKDKIGDWLEMYAKVMELNYWGSTECKSASFDEDEREWTVVVERGGKKISCGRSSWCSRPACRASRSIPTFRAWMSSRATSTIRRRHPGPRRLCREEGGGDRLQQVGARHLRRSLGSRRRRHDGAALATHVVRSEPLTEIAHRALYSEEALAAGITTEKADLIFASMPYGSCHEFQRPLYRADARSAMPTFMSALERAGFMLDWGRTSPGCS